MLVRSVQVQKCEFEPDGTLCQQLDVAYFRHDLNKTEVHSGISKC